MKANYRRVRAQFRPETGFQIKPLPPAPFRAQEADPLERLKRRLLAQRLEEVWEPEANSQLCRAAHEAAALAWVTPYPLLLFPVLFDERAEAAAARAERQADVRQRSPQLLAT
ncbi:MAG: hypothetical protein ABSF95_18180 [Verrucomicrobiota bacterium]